MKVRICEHPKDDVFGIELIAETELDKTIIKRFDEGGIKNNGTTNINQKLQLTFADLIGT